ncbi:MAG: sensor histidine kinase, partial [Candidatus Acidiferrales bacterium]
VHGIANLVDGGWIRLEIQRRDATLVIAVENSFDPETPPRRRNGVGLANVRQRLAARYGNTATFEVKSEEDRFRVGITLPAGEERPAP